LLGRCLRRTVRVHKSPTRQSIKGLQPYLCSVEASQCRTMADARQQAAERRERILSQGQDRLSRIQGYESGPPPEIPPEAPRPVETPDIPARAPSKRPFTALQRLAVVMYSTKKLQLFVAMAIGGLSNLVQFQSISSLTWLLLNEVFSIRFWLG